MEHLVRVLNEGDRQTLAWLCAHVGEPRVTDAARRLIAQRETTAGSPAKPYVSAVCRYLGVRPPEPRQAQHDDADHAVGDRHLAQIRRLLAQCLVTASRPR
ncbi:hypothetical protein P3T23_008921 [Paraburkholderia sp. GAS448]|uniref:hypothetical protein n=1 Tax=Paraburkholderia sp. GAS448 TaxID=3035136 RepID=UPI003D2556A7